MLLNPNNPGAESTTRAISGRHLTNSSCNPSVVTVVTVADRRASPIARIQAAQVDCVWKRVRQSGLSDISSLQGRPMIEAAAKEALAHPFQASADH
jgi:hypothetical protein